MDRLPFAFACVVVLFAAACNPTSLKPGFCHKDGDCPTGKICNANLRCAEPNDGSVEMPEVGAEVAEAGDAHDAEVMLRCPQTISCADGGYDGSAGVCEEDGGVCVECLQDSDCTRDPSKPICEAHVCRGCKADTECKNGPGVCMFHQDGRCATEDETIYVKNSAGCSMTAGGGGTATTPYCFSQLGIDAISLANRVVVMRGPDPLRFFVISGSGDQVTIVGQSGATIAPGADTGVHASGANVYIRDLRIANGSSIGVVVDSGAQFTMDHGTVVSNLRGGILIDGANFDIKNTTVTGNGPGDDAGAAWGGVRLKTLLMTGKKSLQFLTVMDNKQVGVSCSGSVDATSVSVTGSAGNVEISQSCNFSSCGAPAIPTCGAQP